MNVKTYTFVKYIATIASILVLTAPLIVFVQLWRTIFNQQATVITASVILLVIGITALTIYIFLRNILKNKSEYIYKQRDKIKLWISFASYCLSALLATILVIVELTVTANSGMITFYVIYPLVFITMISGAIFESLSRINEQIFLYQKEYLESQEIKKSKIRKIISQQSDAEKLLSKTEMKQEKKLKIDEENDFKKVGSKNPFLDEELNKKLKEQEELDQWLKKDITN
ncbi:hypothetical protein CXP39_01955 [Mesoplasma syrphidae]|uniref:Uncharacterized protein n=1 Tax=Mesoplasma syrphidae TaxID=225999 RepID=A0A2K9C952_9MOLU|nr:MFS transporter [Mesoplasma syrphidae]AUF83555.1 hypothetical protein CXP39_01955 [Mesoplasma syrphidae]